MQIFDANSFSALIAMKMGMVVIVRVLRTLSRAQGVFQFFAAVYGLVDDAFFFKGLQRSVQGDPVNLIEMRLDIVVRQSFPRIEKDVEHLRSDRRFSKVVLCQNVQSGSCHRKK